ncbi:MAG: FAD:protein FMN transferase [Acidobacteriia bacterium]|nr:FAD:protein FMN transferase [Terriglobia bacterium]
MIQQFFLRPLLALILLAAPGEAAQSLVRYEASHEAMGTVFTVVAYGRDRNFLGEVVEQVFQELDRVDAQMSNYKPESELSAINREAASHAVLVEPHLFRLLEQSVQYSRETDGAFDITVGPLMKHWGFFRGRGLLPSPAEITDVLKRVGYQHIKLDPAARTIRFDKSGIELDLGGIAKGYAVDQAVEVLRSNGIASALVSGGTSSIYALGAPPGERGWHVTVRDPYQAGKPADTLILRNYSLSTSGSYEKFFDIGGKTYCHIMDPRTGWPVENMLSTTVLAPSTTESDALSKLFVLGVEGSRRVLAAHPDLTAIFYLPGNSPGHYRRTVLRSAVNHAAPGTLVEVGP